MIFQIIVSTFLGHKGGRIGGKVELIMTQFWFLEDFHRQADLMK